MDILQITLLSPPFTFDGDVDSHGKLCIDSVTVSPALLACVRVTPALLGSVSTQPALLCDIEVNKCQR
jgi:hypothetical protein